MFTQEQQPTVGWFDQLKEKLAFKEWAGSFDFSFNSVMQMLLSTGIGFLCGFVIKKYGKYLLFSIVFGGIVLGFLYYMNVTVIDFVKLKALVGVAETDTFDLIIKHYFEWIRTHALLSVLGIIGFIIGYKVS